MNQTKPDGQENICSCPPIHQILKEQLWYLTICRAVSLPEVQNPVLRDAGKKAMMENLI